jgi:hypothetical protein
LGNDSVTKGGEGEDLVVHRYEISHEKQGQEKTDILLLTIARFPPGETGFVHWQVREVGVHNPNFRPL